MRENDLGKKVLLSEEYAKTMPWKEILNLIKKYDAYDLTENDEFQKIEKLLINDNYSGLSKQQYKVFYNALKHSGVTADTHYSNESKMEAMVIRAFYREHYEFNELRKKYGGGCYIATSAYGDYNHPQVIKLRRFRDNILEKKLFGRWFIKVYYLLSPIITLLFGKIGLFNRINRFLLNKIIDFIDIKTNPNEDK